jgi:serine/threonine-protein kinase RsbW
MPPERLAGRPACRSAHPGHPRIAPGPPPVAQSAILNDTEFELDGSLSELGRLVEQVDRFCQAAGLDGEAAFELNLVLEELFTNAVRHGGCEGMKNAVHVRFRLIENGGVSVQFRDRGVPFDPTLAARPDLAAPLSQRQPGGLGIHLVRQTMSDLQYRRAGDWNQLTMRREGKHEANL